MSVSFARLSLSILPRPCPASLGIRSVGQCDLRRVCALAAVDRATSCAVNLESTTLSALTAQFMAGR